MSAVKKITQGTREDIEHFVTHHMGEEENTWKHQRQVQKVKCQGVLISYIIGRGETIFEGKRDKVDKLANAFEEEIGERRRKGEYIIANEKPSSSAIRDIPLPEEHHPKLPQQPRVKTERELEISRLGERAARWDEEAPGGPYYLGYYYTSDNRFAQDNRTISNEPKVNDKM